MYSKPGNHSTFEVVKGGVEYTLGEIAPATTNPPGIQYDPGQWSCTGPAVLTGNKVTIPAGTQTTCSITNTRTHGLTLQKEWVDGVSGDTAALTITGGTGGSATSTSNGDSGPWTDPTNKATSTVPVNTEVKIGEQLGGTNQGTYTTDAVKCTKTGDTNTVVPVTSGGFTMPNYPVTCTYTNRNATNTVQLEKKWVDGVKDDTTTLSLQVGSSPATTKVSTSNGDAAPLDRPGRVVGYRG